MELDAGHDRRDWTRFDVFQTFDGCADQNDAPLDLAAIEIGFGEVGYWKEPLLLMAGVIQEDIAGRCRRDCFFRVETTTDLHLADATTKEGKPTFLGTAD